MRWGGGGRRGKTTVCFKFSVSDPQDILEISQPYVRS